ncbi:MAG: geranylgeranylglycerol-phosphate geranylgeranyltransferase [Flavobacteriales bacterium]|nr:geranylgeranylglycerol-phosphate geranylgeranyltransferase [Flavobacteriales bacterium]
MLSFIKLIRLPNLLIIALTQYLVRYAIIDRYIGYQEMNLQLSDFNFFLLSLSTVMLAAAGYIINDYFDIKIDRINRPESIIVGNTIKRRVAMGAHIVINFIAIAIAYYISAYAVGIKGLVMIHIVVASLLWFYSTNFKKQFLVGNIVIAIISAAVPFIVGLYDIAVLNAIYWKEVLNHGIYFNGLFILIAWYSLFASLTTLIREIIKDIEDYDGDIAFKSKTLPIVLGMQKAKWVVLGITGILFICVGYVVYLESLQERFKALSYLIVLVETPLVILCVMLFRANTKKHYTNISFLLKGIIITGIFSMFLI